MTVRIRQETERDYPVSAQVVEEAFEHAAFSDHTEHHLVANLRKSDVFLYHNSPWWQKMRE